ncbi:hypothetical protein HJC23_007061 [Cyclotella cryptica]|uniref:Uncharacterized protein n=1 Tax=Cyclotella cryptica TaxID=29204 RepID=A0ABD3PDZ3_9STRA|eukprot:CCRYP_016473-RA/>CCRYP_016473-RA protein AED:0.06 eAED:0.06 QI:122/1/1/1/1/1/3/90/149
MVSHQDQRRHLDFLFLTDSIVSLAFGVAALLSPHGLLQKIGGGEYNHSAHEGLRLYGCLRIAVGWIIYHVRAVDDGRFRRNVCEALFVCYMLQAVAVLRAQFTDRRNTVNWIAILLLSLIGFGYGRFRFGRGGDMIKVYELPQNNKIAR